MKIILLITLALTTTISNGVLAKSFRLLPHQVTIVNDTHEEVSKAIVNVTISCMRNNMVVGPETISSQHSSKELILSTTSTETSFQLDSLNISCFSLFGNRWISTSVSVFYPEIKKVNGYSLNGHNERYSGRIMNQILASDLEYVSIGKARTTLRY